MTAAAGGAAVRGVRVASMDGSGNQLATATTSATGTYTLTGLAPTADGDIVCFDASLAAGNATGFASQCYDGVAWTAGNPPPDRAAPVRVRAGRTTRGINVALTALGAISGQVTAAAGGAGVGGVQVDVYDPYGGELASASTSAAGTYTVTGLAPAFAADVVCFDASRADSAAGLASQCYQGLAWTAGSSPPDGATQLGVGAGTTTSGINAALAAWGAVSGRVTGAGGAGVGGVRVEVFDGSGSQLASATTSAAGTYTVTGLASAAGDVVCFDASQAPGSATGFASQCYQGVAWAAASPPPAGVTPVKVTVGMTTAGINAALTAGGAVSGRVTGAGGAGVSGVHVDVFDGSGNQLASATTSAAGTYTLTGLAAAPDGDIVCFNTAQAEDYMSQCYNGVTWDGVGPPAGVTPVKVTLGTMTTGINAALATWGAISGQVTAAADGAPVGGVGVDAYDANPVGVVSEWAGGTTTSAAGTYTLTGLSPATDYLVCFNTADTLVPLNFASQCYDGADWDGGAAPPADGATPVSVTAGTTTAGIDAALTPLGAISGRVTAAAGGAPVSGVQVDVYDPYWDLLASATTSAAGTYTVIDLASAPGDVVCFDASQAPGSATGFASQCYKGVAWGGGYSPPPAGATLVGVTVGTTTAGINAALTPAGEISGTVTAAAGGAPVSDVLVNVMDSSGNPMATATTPAAGTYTLTGLTPLSGGDTVCFDATHALGATGLASQCYKGVAWAGGQSPPPAGVTPVRVRAGRTAAGINAALATAAMNRPARTEGSMLRRPAGTARLWRGVGVRDLEGHALVGAEGDAECPEVVDVADLLAAAHVGDDGSGG